MPATSATESVAAQPIRGKIVEAEIKVSTDAARQLPLACALYAIETDDGTWLCAYYGNNRSVFDFLPQKGWEIDEAQLGIMFHHRQFVPEEEYQPARWEEFKQTRLMTYSSH